MAFGDIFAQMVGVQPKVRTTNDGKTKGDMANKAASELADATYSALKAMQLGGEDLWDMTRKELTAAAEVSSEKLGEGMQFTKEQLLAAAEYAREEGAKGASVLGEKLSHAAGVVQEEGAAAAESAWKTTQEYSGYAADVAADQAAKQYENAKQLTAEQYEAAKKLAAEQYENAKHLAADGVEYSQEKVKAGVNELPNLARSTYELAGNTLEVFEDAAGNTIERVTDAAGNYYQRVLKAAQSTAERFTDEAGNEYELIKDAAGKQTARLVRKAGESADIAYRRASETAQDAQHEAHGLFEHVNGGLAHISHSIGSLFSSKSKDAEQLAKDAYDATTKEGSRLASQGRQYAEDAASQLQSGYDEAKSLLDSKQWSKFFSRNPNMDAKEWTRYLQSANINPKYWIEYMTAYQKGPKGLNAFWQKAEKKGYAAKDAVQGQYYTTKGGLQQSWRSGRLGSGGDEDAAAPVSLFWTAVLALYLLVLAKRVFEQKRLLVSHEKDGRDTPASSAAEKMRLSDVARASSDSLSTFAIYAPATAVVLLTHELQNAASPYVLHGLYAALFVGQILQNEATYVSTAKAKGAGIYLSWAAAGLAGAAGIMTSLTGFRL